MDSKEFNKLLKIITTDEKALETLYNYYYKRIIYHFHNNYGRELAEDAAQNFFINLLKKTNEYSYISYPTSWVYKCCQNILNRLIRKENNFIELNETIAATENFEFDYITIFADLYESIEHVDDISKKIIVLFHWEGYSLKEIASILELKYPTVRQKYRRALIKCKRNIKQLSHF